MKEYDKKELIDNIFGYILYAGFYAVMLLVFYLIAYLSSSGY